MVDVHAASESNLCWEDSPDRTSPEGFHTGCSMAYRYEDIKKQKRFLDAVKALKLREALGQVKPSPVKPVYILRGDGSVFAMLRCSNFRPGNSVERIRYFTFPERMKIIRRWYFSTLEEKKSFWDPRIEGPLPDYVDPEKGPIPMPSISPYTWFNEKGLSQRVWKAGRYWLVFRGLIVEETNTPEEFCESNIPGYKVVRDMQERADRIWLLKGVLTVGSFVASIVYLFIK